MPSLVSPAKHFYCNRNQTNVATYSALQFVHEAGWLHRDISAGNILIDSSDELRLADFEYAKRIDDESSHDVRTVS